MHGLAVVIHVLCGDGFAFEYRSCDAHIQNLQLCQQGAGLGGSDQVFLVFIADVFDQQGNQVAQFLRFTALSGKGSLWLRTLPKFWGFDFFSKFP